MALECPWCGSAVDCELVASLTKISQPAPCCGKPIAQSFWQVVFDVLLFSPLIVLMLFLSKLTFEAGHRSWAVVVILLGIAICVYLHRFIPIVHGPGRGFRIRTPSP